MKLTSVKYLDEREKDKLLSFLRRFRTQGIDFISQYYPLDAYLLDTYFNIWNWRNVSINKNIEWTSGIIEKFKYCLEWHAEFDNGWIYECLSLNDKIPWSIDLIEKYKDYWDWSVLSMNTSLPWSVSLIDKYIDKWNWYNMSMNKALPWTFDFIKKYESKLDIERMSWENLSANTSISWSINLLKYYEDRWDWEVLSRNVSLPWSAGLIEAFEDKWEWTSSVDIPYGGLSLNEGVSFTPELLNKFKDKWYIDDLLKNKSYTREENSISEIKLLIGFNEEYINKQLNENVLEIPNKYNEICYNHYNRYRWKSGQDEGLLWTNDIRELMCEIIKGNKAYPDWIKYPDRYNWDDSNIEFEYKSYLKNLWQELSATYSNDWTPDLVEKYKDKWDWSILSSNPTLPWSITLIYQFRDKWDWNQLSRNDGINFENHFDLIYEFRNRLNYWSVKSKAKEFNWAFELIEKWYSGNFYLDVNRIELPEEVFNKILTPYLEYDLHYILVEFLENNN